MHYELLSNFIIEKFLALIFCFLILGNAKLSLLIYKDNLHPSVLFSFYWFFITITSIIIVIEVPINPFAIFYIFILCLSFTLSGVIFAKIQNNINYTKTNNFNLNNIFISRVYKISVIFGLFFSFLVIVNNGFSLSNIASNLLSTASEFAKKRTTDELEYGVVGMFSIFFSNFSALFGGIYSFYFRRKKKIIIVFFSMLPSIFIMLTQSSKIVFLVAALLNFAGRFLVMSFENRQIKIDKKVFKNLLYILVVLIPLLIISFMSREGYNDFYSFGEAYNKLKPTINSYFFGSIFAFSDFFSAYTTNVSISKYKIEYYNLGYFSFKPIFEFFGGTKVFPPTFYDDEFSYNKNLQTNLYTAFRGYIQDFGIVGTVLFFLFFGFIINYSFYKIKNSKYAVISSSFYIMFIAFLGLSFIINIFTSRYIFLVSFVLVIVLYINNKLFSKK